MAVLIKGMEMPKDYAVVLKIFPDGKVGTVPYIQWFKVDRIEGAQAVPVPPHGLIDRERILDSIRIELAQVNAVNDMEDYDSWMRVFDYVRKFPTVIPASEEEVDEAQRDYQAAADYQQYCETYEQTYDPETGAM